MLGFFGYRLWRFKKIFFFKISLFPSQSSFDFLKKKLFSPLSQFHAMLKITLYNVG